MTFAEFMEDSLYGPRGYYASGQARSGQAGDYFTAPDVGPAFGHLLAEIFRGWQRKLSLPSFHLIEAGAGEGALAQSIHHAAPEFPYSAIERSPARREKLTRLGFPAESDLDAWAAHPTTGCLFGNELLDAFPVHRIRMNNGWLEEAYVEDQAFRWGTPSTKELTAYLARLDIELPEGYETEINLAMAGWFRSAASALSQGLVLLIDYGRPAHAYYAPERDQGTLRSFRNHRVGSDFLSAPGLTDLTADVDFTSAALDARDAGLKPLAYMDLGSFLIEGAKSLHAALPGMQYVIHPEGMGSTFQVLILGKDVELSESDFPNNRLKRLGLEEINARSRG